VVQLRRSWTRLKTWYETNFTWRGLAAMLWFIATVIPDMFGREDFWSTHLPVLWKHVYAHGTVATVIAVGLIIWLDHRRMVKRPSPVADSSLRGRTLAFCDELKTFEKELGPEPPVNWKPSHTAASFTEANQGLIEREQRMHHLFHLRFYERAVHLWHEHGAEVRESQSLADALGGRIGSDEKLNQIIEQFTELAKD
jgi:hypothetical protein